MATKPRIRRSHHGRLEVSYPYIVPRPHKRSLIIWPSILHGALKGSLFHFSWLALFRIGCGFYSKVLEQVVKSFTSHYTPNPSCVEAPIWMSVHVPSCSTYKNADYRQNFTKFGFIIDLEVYLPFWVIGYIGNARRGLHNITQPSHWDYGKGQGQLPKATPALRREGEDILGCLGEKPPGSKPRIAELLYCTCKPHSCLLGNKAGDWKLALILVCDFW